MIPVGVELSRAVTRLVEAGVDSPVADAEWLLTDLLGVSRSLLPEAGDLDAPTVDRYRAAVDRRCVRVPLQHITGTAVLGPAEVRVGPGVFIPRPETEALLEWALTRSDVLAPTGSGHGAPLIVDLCSGSGALALAVAHSNPAARVTAVENSPAALDWLRANVADHADQPDSGARVEVIEADVTAVTRMTELIAPGSVDLVVANPPYVPADAPVSPEVAADPASAVFAGADGMTVIEPMVTVVAALLRPGGRVGVEHDDTTAAQVTAAFEAAGAFDEIESRRDLTGRERFVTARRRIADGDDGDARAKMSG